MNIKIILIPLLIILLLFSIVVMGAPTYVNLGPTSEITGDVGVPDGSGYYINDILFSTTGLIDISTLAKTDSNFIVGDGTNWIVESGSTARASLGIDLSLYYLKTEIDTLSEVETIYNKDIIDSDELAALKFTDLADTPANYTGQAGKYVKVNAGETDLEFGIPTGAGTYLELTDTPATYDNGKYAKSTAAGVVWDIPSGGYTNLTSFVDQTAWRLFYSNNLGDVIELALGTDGQYLKSTGATSAPEFDTPTGAGDMLKATYDNDEDGDIDVAAGGTEKSLWTLYCIPYLSGTTAFGEITIGTEGQVLKVAAGATGYEWGTLSYLANVVEDTTPELGGEMDAGAHSIGFTLQTDTGTGEKTIDWKLGNKMKFTIGAGNVTFIFTAPTNPCTLMLTLIQDGTGSRTVIWPATVKWPGGTAPTLTTTANARDKIALDWDGTQYDGVCSKDFK